MNETFYFHKSKLNFYNTILKLCDLIVTASYYQNNSKFLISNKLKNYKLKEMYT